MSRATGSASGVPSVDGYTVIEQIDAGGFSRVYRATQHGLERNVAVKILNASFEDERQQKTFERECRVMGQLSTHPNIVTVFASALTGHGHPCIIMELYEGTYRGDQQLDIAEVVDVGAKVADALQAIHDDGIVHRDIKPHNIFVSSHGQPAIGDFGISSIESERTVTGGAGFSINYAPPEVFEEGGAGAAGDVYSLGATLYQLASGEVPFPHTGDPSERTRATVHKIITATPPGLRRPDAPPELSRLLQRCMAKNPADRPASPAVVATELRKLQRQIGIPDPLSALKRVRGAVSPSVPDPTIDRAGATAEPSVRTTGRAHTPTNATGGVTVVRDRAQPATNEPVDAETPTTAPASPRPLLIGGMAALAVIVVSTVAISLLGGGSSDEPEATSTAADPTTTAAPFVVLDPPDDLTVERPSEGVYQLSWTAEEGDVDYQILLVGGSETRFSDEDEYSWQVADDSGSACFEVRTVNSERTRVSQSAAGPVCAG